MKYPHIASDARIAGGVPIIKGTRIAVRTVAGYYQLGMTPDEILQSLPHLTPAQLHAALTYYFDHQKQVDRDLKRNADVDHWRRQVRPALPVAA
ncbi:MAG: DUF433 domain-containing protein [Pedosphaera sp.]|nr:DUF433 domain-containing protein [Pedosphaera sp.]